MHSVTKRAIEPTHYPYYDYRTHTFSLGLETGAGVVLSGHTAVRYSAESGAMVVENDLVAQSRLAYEKIATILGAAGLGLRDVVRTVDYVTATAIADYGKTAALRRELFGDRPPATSTVVVKRLLRPTAFIEIEVLASRGDGDVVDGGPPSDAMHRAPARRVGDLVYITGQIALRPGTGEVVAPGDIVAQARQIYENAGRILRAAGLDWEHVVKTVEFLSPEGLAQYKHTGQVRRDFLAPHYPAATGIIMPCLDHPEALLQVDFVASRQPKAAVNPGWSRHEKLTYVPGVKAGGMLFLAGQGAVHSETHTVEHPGDIVAQTRDVYRKVVEVLAAAGVGPDAVVKTVEFITPAALPRYRETAEVRRDLFAAPYPAATGIVCEALLRPEMLIEVDAWAVLP